MDWYIVVKTIKGKRYYYRQKTWRDGKNIRTRSEYVGPVDSGGCDPVLPPAATRQTTLKKLADDSLDILLGEKAEGWEHHWNGDREGPVLVARLPAVDEVIKGLGVKWSHNTSGAFFRPATGQVNIPPLRCFIDKEGQSATAAYYIVVFHELVHWTKRHIERPSGFDGSQYAREELVAELGAVMLMKHFNIEIGNTARHALYFQTWLSRIKSSLCTNSAALKFASKEAQRAVQYILERDRMNI